MGWRHNAERAYDDIQDWGRGRGRRPGVHKRHVYIYLTTYPTISMIGGGEPHTGSTTDRNTRRRDLPSKYPDGYSSESGRGG